MCKWVTLPILATTDQNLDQGSRGQKTDSTLSTGSRVSQKDVHTRSYTHTQSHKLAEVGDMEDLSPFRVSGVGMDKGLGLLTCRR